MGGGHLRRQSWRHLPARSRPCLRKVAVELNDTDNVNVPAEIHTADLASATSVGPSDAPPPVISSRVGLTLQAAIDSVNQSSTSSETMAMETAQRLIRTMAAWLETLDQRKVQLETELNVRLRELDNLRSLIENERKSAGILAGAARQWSDEIQSEFARKQESLAEEAREMARQAMAINDSIRHLLTEINPTPSIAPGGDVVGSPRPEVSPSTFSTPNGQTAIVHVNEAS